jgi:hypothetical protein
MHGFFYWMQQSGSKPETSERQDFFRKPIADNYLVNINMTHWELKGARIREHSEIFAQSGEHSGDSGEAPRDPQSDAFLRDIGHLGRRANQKNSNNNRYMSGM